MDIERQFKDIKVSSKAGSKHGYTVLGSERSSITSRDRGQLQQESCQKPKVLSKFKSELLKYS